MNLLKLVLSIFIVLLVLLYWTRKDSLNSSLACQELRYFKKTEFRGMVIEKYIDQRNHGAETVRIKRATEVFNFVLPVNASKIYEYVKSGDSVLKKKDEHHVEVYRTDSIKRFEIWFGCTSD